MFYSDTNKRNSKIAKSLAGAAIASTALALVAPDDAHGELQDGQVLTVIHSYMGEQYDPYEIEVGEQTGPYQLGYFSAWSLMVSEPHEIWLTIYNYGGLAFGDIGAANYEYGDYPWAEFWVYDFVWLDENGAPMDLAGVTLWQTDGETVPTHLTPTDDGLALHIEIPFNPFGGSSQGGFSQEAEYHFTFHHAEVPEPSTYALMGSMLGAAAYLRKRKERTA